VQIGFYAFLYHAKRLISGLKEEWGYPIRSTT